jgi:hypothetical protein
MVAAGTTAPDASVTVPIMLPVSVCALSAGAIREMTSTTIAATIDLAWRSRQVRKLAVFNITMPSKIVDKR